VAGDWIKWTCGLTRKPEVVRMAAQLSLMREVVACRLMDFWEWCDSNIPDSAIRDDGTAFVKMSPHDGDNMAFVDALVCTPNFAVSLVSVDWIHFRHGHIEIPNFGRHNGQTAKTRARNAKNQHSRREKQEDVSTVPKMSPRDGDKKVTREEKRRIEKSNTETQGEENVADAPASPDFLIRDGCSAPAAEIIAKFDAAFGCRSLLTDKRKIALKARWKDPWWRENWEAAIERGRVSAFLRGANDRSWMIDFEFFLKPDSVAKIVEGKYDNRADTRSTLTANERREQVNASSFDLIRQAAAASGG